MLVSFPFKRKQVKVIHHPHCGGIVWEVLTHTSMRGRELNRINISIKRRTVIIWR
jgi:hypothetical protein